MNRSGKRAVLVLVAVILAGATAALAQRTLLAVEPRQSGARRDGAAPPAAVSLVSEGGFRWARVERISVVEQNGRCSITIERVPYDGRTQGPATVAISRAQYDALLGELTANDALRLKDDASKRGVVRDAPDYQIAVTIKDKSNRFRVFAPQVLHNAYTTIVDAIEALAEKALPSPAM